MVDMGSEIKYVYVTVRACQSSLELAFTTTSCQASSQTWTSLNLTTLEIWRHLKQSKKIWSHG